MTIPPDVIAKFWSFVTVLGSNDCWEWRKSRAKKLQYPEFIFAGRKFKANIFSFWVTTGELPATGIEICHSCDNKRCVNPTHLFPGTHQENMQDYARKGGMKGPRPSIRGTLHHGARLTEDAVLVIRSSERTLLALAQVYGVTEQAIWRARHRKTWTHL